MEIKLKLDIAHLWQGHKTRNITLLHNVELSGLDCVLTVVHTNNQLLDALRPLAVGVGKGKLRSGLSYGVPNATVVVLIAELHQVLRGHSRSHRPCASNPKPSRSASGAER